MPASQLEARSVSYLELIGNGRSFSVPPAQRDYSWNVEQWGDLWSDILNLRDKTDDRHYMGALVVEAKDDRDLLVIDGQQRLATLGILTLAVIGRLTELAEEGVDPENNRSRAQILRDGFVARKRAASLTETSRLSLNETDNGFYQDYVVQLRTPGNRRSLPTSHRLIHDCYRFFRNRLADFEGVSTDGEALGGLIEEAVGRQLRFTLITVDEGATTHAMFEALRDTVRRGMGARRVDADSRGVSAAVDGAAGRHDLEGRP